MDRKIRVLVITYSSLRVDNNNGNSYSNIFEGLCDKMEFACIYFKDDMPKNNLSKKYFHISEKGLMRSAFTRKPVGEKLFLKDSYNTVCAHYSSAYNKARSLRWESILFARDYLTLIGNWKTKALDDFVKDYKPDLIFGNLHFVPVYNRIMTYLSKRFSIPLAVYSWDDYYSIQRFSYSPMYWIRFWMERQDIKKCAKQASYMYCITKEMQEEYTRYFNKKCKVLYKGYDFIGKPYISEKIRNPVKFIFTGNIGYGRWKVLTVIAQELEKVNSEKPGSARLDVYTFTPISNQISEALNIDGSSCIHGFVSSDEADRLRKVSDVLVHVEPTTKMERLYCRLSFSTKIVDYFYNAKAVLALGGPTASMNYLKNNDAALVETDPKKFGDVVRKFACNTDLIREYALKAWECGKRNHQIKDIQAMILNDFEAIVSKERQEMEA